jgi:hypothetical protein
MTTTTGRSHGTPGKYAEGCRCDVCTDANTARNYASKVKREGREPTVHNASTYRNWGHRCDECVEANRLLLLKNQRAAGTGVNSRNSWTDEDLDLVFARKDNRRYRYTAKEVALKVGRSVAAVNAKRARGRVDLRSSVAAPSE